MPDCPLLVTVDPEYELWKKNQPESRCGYEKKDYAKMEKSFLMAMASMMGAIFSSEMPNLSMYI